MCVGIVYNLHDQLNLNAIETKNISDCQFYSYDNCPNYGVEGPISAVKGLITSWVSMSPCICPGVAGVHDIFGREFARDSLCQQKQIHKPI